MSRVSIGVDLGGTNMRFGLVSAAGEIIERSRTATKAEEGVDAVLGRIVDGIMKMRDKAVSSGHGISGAGIGVPGIISMPEGVVRVSPNLTGWTDVPLKARLEDATGLTVAVENDANAYGLGEFLHGAGKGASSMVCFTLGTGVGGGVILNGDVWRGADGMGGEVGHITVFPAGRKCNCGNRGCVERYASATAVVERTVEAIEKGEPSTLSGPYGDDPANVTALSVKLAAEAGDRLARRMYTDAGKALGIVAADLINLLNIDRIVVGGGMAGAWGLLEGPMRAEVKKRAFAIPAARCGIFPGTLGDDAAIIGSAGLIR